MDIKRRYESQSEEESMPTPHSSEDDAVGFSPPVSNNGRVKRQKTTKDTHDYTNEESESALMAETPKSIGDVSLELNSQNAYNEVLESAAQSLERTRDEGFREGSIIALGLKNFQVSTRIAWRFSPSLNLIIGSNGSGKSTVITAIFLLFLGRISDLQRKNYSGFVKNGASAGEIVAVIQGKPGSGATHNPTISMTIQSSHQRGRNNQGNDGESHSMPQWYIDNAHVPIKAVKAFIQNYDIQVNNLCQYLPQTRVAAFSGEPKEERLFSTEAAVGYNGMVDDHKLLIEAGSRLSTLLTSHNQLETQIESEEKNRQHYTEILERLYESEQKRADQMYYQLLIPLIRYDHAKREADEVERQMATKKEQLESVQIRYKAVVDVENDAKAHIAELESKYKSSVRSFYKTTDELRSASSRSMDIRTKIMSLYSAISEANEERNSRGDKIAEAVAEVRKIKGIVATLREELASEDETRKLKEGKILAENEVARFDTDFNKVNEELSYTNSQIRQVSIAIEKATRTLNSLQSDERNRDVSMLPSLFQRRETGQNLLKAIKFVESLKERNQLRGEVYMPALVSVSITEKAALAQFEALASAKNLQRFLCESREDFYNLTRLAREEGVEMPAAIVSSSSDSVRLPFSPNELKKLGFNGYLTDILTGPAAVINFLASQTSLGRAAYSIDVIPETTLEYLTKSGFTGVCVDSKHSYEYSRSPYGKRNQILQTNDVSQERREAWPEYMCVKNTGAQQAILRQKIDKCMEQEESLKAAKAEKASRLAELDELSAPARDDLKQITYSLTQINKSRMVIASQESRLKDRAASVEKLKEQEANHAQKIAQSVRKINELKLRVDASKPVALLKKLHEHQRQAINTQLTLCTHKNVYERLHYLLSEHRKKIRNEIHLLEERLSRLRSSVELEERQNNDASSKLSELGRLDEARNEMKKATIEETSRRIAELRAEINLSETGENYEETQELLARTERSLETLRQHLSRENGALERYRSTVDRTKVKWEDALQRLIQHVDSKYSEMFTELGCSGGVSLITNGLNFDKWGIDIRVSFREGEVPNSLSRQRQSGGERAVSTAVYLLALQDMAKAPFRVVDEINQGMDEANERKTHQFLVSHACNANSQYFLVTPKLLWDLPYHQMQDVAVIFSSSTVQQGMISPPTTGDEILKCYKADNDDI